MAKRRMRRTSSQTSSAANAGKLTDGLVDQARQTSVSMVKAALSSMQEIGRAMADMAAPAARRGMAAAADAGRATVDGATKASQLASKAMVSAADSARTTTSRATRRPAAPKTRKTRKTRPAA